MSRQDICRRCGEPLRCDLNAVAYCATCRRVDHAEIDRLLRGDQLILREVSSRTKDQREPQGVDA